MDDHEIRYEDVRANGLSFNVASCGEGDRLALCLHGFPELSYSWRAQLPLLARLGYRAWAPDMRGYGGTDRPLSYHDYALELLVDDVAGLIEESGAREVVLIAHDWGAIIAWAYAMRPPRPIDRLIIMNVPHPGAARKTFSLRQLGRSWYVLFFQIPWLPEWVLTRNGAEAVGRAFRDMAVDKSRFPDEVLDVYRQAACKPGAAKAMVDYYRALVRGGGARRLGARPYPMIETPTLVVWGEEDAALGVELTHATGDFVKDLTIRTLPGVSHWVQQEAPETVNAMLEAWLTGRTVPEAAQISG
ncbi:MAG: alpha/beta hydrolase [Deltaproteobacteria bacterium]|nr:alpha/beta hydrolase [Deltaproteobacteria bacterium]